MQIIWDEPKRQANLEKHGLDFASLDAQFFEEAIIRPAKKNRMFAFGVLADGTSPWFFPTSAQKRCRWFQCAPRVLQKGDSMSKRMTEFEPGHGYTKEDWDEVSDSPEWTEEDFKNARPFAEVFPDLAESIRRARGRPAVDAPKQQISLRLDPDVIEKFRATGKGWQSRINDVLKAAKLD